MKRILVLLDGGIAHDGRVQRVIHSLSNDFFVDLYYPDSKTDDNLLFTSNNVNLISYKKEESWCKNNLFFHNKFDQLISKVLEHKKVYHAIYCNDYPLLKASTELKNKLNCPLIYDSHEIYIETINQFFPTKGPKGILIGYPLIKINKLFHNYCENKYIKKIDLFVTVCESFCNYFKRKYKLKNYVVLKNCHRLIHNIGKKNILKERLRLTKHDKVLIYQGVINPGRGLEKIVSASKEFNDNIHFIILGDGPSKQNLKSEVIAMNVQNIHFIDKVPFENLLEYISSADIGILLIESINLSKRLTLPNKVFEYMSASIPVITNKLPEASKIVSENNCGFIIDDSNPHSIAKEINSIFNKEYKTFGLNGKKAIREIYNWDNEFKETKIKIEELMNLPEDSFT